ARSLSLYSVASSHAPVFLFLSSYPEGNPQFAFFCTSATMVFYILDFTAELENLTNLQQRGGCSDPNYTYYFKVSATLLLITYLIVLQCKLCGREGTIQMVPGHGEPLTIERSQAGIRSKLMVFDCRGFEPVNFSFENRWKAESVSIPGF
ncbi:hypothetical protein BHE74_00048137, partial [Ensete ventricosum]